MARKTTETSAIDLLLSKRDEFALAGLVKVAEIIQLEDAGESLKDRTDPTEDKIENAARALFNGTGYLLEPKRKSRSTQDRLRQLYEEKAALNRAEELAARRLDVLLTQEAENRAAEIAFAWRSAQRDRVLKVAQLLRLNREIESMRESVGDATSLPLSEFHANRLLGRGEGQPGSTGHLPNQLVAEAIRLKLVTPKEISDA